MSNVYGALDATVLDVIVDPYAIATSAVTQLSFSSLESPQNQTRDITKIIKKKLPVESGNDELVFPFDSTLFTAPLSYVAETTLPISLGQAVTKADEATTDPKASTYTINQIMPEDVVAETTYLVNVLRFIPGQTQQRNFTWSSLDTPAMVCAKWKATMDPAIAYAGFTQSFGHAALAFDSTTASTEWGTFNNGIYYEVDRYSGSNASKINLGLNTSSTLNIFWDRYMGTCSFANVASCAYVRYGVVIDASKRIMVEILATGDVAITRNPEGASPIAFYHQIYKPVLRICGGAFVATGWRVSASSIYQNNTSFNPNLAFDRNTTTYWASAEQAYTSAGQGSQYVQIEYPEAVKMTSYKIDPNTRYTGEGAPLQWNISASNKNSTFVTIETFQFNAW
ncbi:hypothetical protein T492DRAFT_847798 [Pavlovales sp. CCMP2436]|nr:hypothetical protein T492DRAFT_847798 [Pavlovales sp. CCMP2436]